MKLDNPTTRSMFNKICYVIAALSGTLGILTGWLINNQQIIYIEIAITTCFVVLPNSKVSMVAKVVLFFMVLNTALVYWGVLLGPVAQIQILVAFLIGAAVLFLRGQKQVAYPVIHVLLMVLFLELNYYNNWLEPIPMKHEVATIIRWIVIFTGSSLSCLVIYFFYKNWVAKKVEKLVNELNTTNEQLNETNYALNEANAAIQKASEEKTAYIQHTTHEMRTPLTNIIGAVEVLKSQIINYDQNTQDLISNIDHSANVARLIINQVLDIAKIEAGGMHEVKYQNIDLKDLINNCKSIQKYYIKNPPEIKVVYDKRLPDEIVIESDRMFLLSIINNLFSNAIKFSNGKEVLLNVKKKRNNIYFQIKNTGELSSEQLGNMFTPYVSKRGAVDGTGLGLPITRQLIELLGGEIHATSGEGMVVLYFRIPYKPGILLDAEIKDEKRILNFKKILCVEDNEMSLQMLKRYFSDQGAVVFTARNGVEALLILEREQAEVKRIDFVFTDDNMPEMGGLELVTRIRQNQKYNDVQVFAASGTEFKEVIKQFREAGATAFISKPFSLSDLLKIIEVYQEPILEREK